jgi:branched-chain amino acid aminotransferase
MSTGRDRQLAYRNGRFLPFADVGLSPHDAGFVWGATVVDNCRTYNGTLFRWRDHLVRFRRDCAACYVPLTATDQELTAAAETLVAANRGNGEVHVVTFATPGPLGFYAHETTDGPPTLGMVTYCVDPIRYEHYFTEGVTLCAAVNPNHTPNRFLDTLVSPSVKHRSRMAWWVAERAKTAVGYPARAVPLFFDRPGGTPTETAHANLLAVADGEVVTPPRHLVLDGITLRVVEELCGQLGLTFRPSPLDTITPPAVTEMILCGTGFGVAGVREFLPAPHAEPVRFSWPGPVYRRLKAAWDSLVARRPAR